MATPSASPRVIRFGAFEMDARTGELRKHGIRIKLQDQPFAILKMLLERPGDLVTRDQIREKLWPADTFVDFDHSLNTAIRRLRDALSDSADNPKFIETLPRRGYRFLAEVQGAGAVTAEPVPASTESQTAPAQPPAAMEAVQRMEETPAFPPRPQGIRPLVLAMVGAALVVAAVAAWRFWPRPAIDSIAVLPFVNATNDADLDYLSDGIAESVMANLSQVPTLKVMSRNSAFRYKGKTPDPKQVAREIGVRAVLLGTMRQQGSKVRMSLELVDTRDGRQLWGADVERPRDEIPQMEQEISQQVSEKLRLRLTGEQQDRLARRHVPSPEAYDLYLRGHQALQKRTNAEIRRGLEFLQRAIDADPAYADAYAEMSAAYGMLSFYGGMEPKEAFLREDAAVRRAVELSPDSARARVQLGYFLGDAHRDLPGAEREWKRAIEMEPNSAEAHHGYSMLLSVRGRVDEALREAHLTEKLDPLWPGSRGTTSMILLYARRYPEAERYAHNAGTGFAPAYWILGQVCEEQGRYKEAIEAFQETIKAYGRGSFSEAMLAHAYAIAGQKKEAQALLAELIELHKTSYFSPTNIAAVYVGLGDQNSALQWLKIADEQRDPWLARLEVDPRFDPLRKVPEFRAFVQKAFTPD